MLAAAPQEPGSGGAEHSAAPLVVDRELRLVFEAFPSAPAAVRPPPLVTTADAVEGRCEGMMAAEDVADLNAGRMTCAALLDCCCCDDCCDNCCGSCWGGS